MYSALERKKEVIFGIFITSIVVANVIAGKIVAFGPFVTPAAIVVYAVTFLMTDLVSEIWGRRDANRLVFLGFVCSIFASIMILLASKLPSASFAADRGKAFDLILGMNLRFTVASMVAYYISQSWDVWVFHILGIRTDGKHKWLRNNLSTMSSQIIDTSIFITIAFWGVVPDIVQMIASQYIVKFILALLDTPVFYFFTRGIRMGRFVKQQFVIK